MLAPSSKRRGPPPKDGYGWLKGQLAPLAASGRRAEKIYPDVVHDYGYHSGLKLAAIRHCADVFAKVARHQVDVKRRYDGAVFLDLFAGCGVNRMPDQSVVAGTPFIGLDPGFAFDRVVLVESNLVRANALRDRLTDQFGTGRWDLVERNCNDAIGEVLDTIGLERPMVFAVVDQERLQAQFDTLRTLSDRFKVVDMVLTMPTGAQRELAAAQAAGRESPALEGTVGKTVAQILEESKGNAIGALAEQIQSVLGRELGSGTPIATEAGPALYEFQIYTRNTPGGSPYVEGYKAAHRRLGQVQPLEVKSALAAIEDRAPLGF